MCTIIWTHFLPNLWLLVVNSWIFDFFSGQDRLCPECLEVRGPSIKFWPGTPIIWCCHFICIYSLYIFSIYILYIYILYIYSLYIYILYIYSLYIFSIYTTKETFELDLIRVCIWWIKKIFWGKKFLSPKTCLGLKVFLAQNNYLGE